MGLIWLIIVVIIIVNATKKQAGKNVRDSRGVPHQQWRSGVPNQQARPSAGAYTANKNTYAKQDEKFRQNDILSRATANVMGNAADNLKQQGDENTYSPTVTMDAEQSGELMRQVNDLMIMGYQADISFERDFLAEGMELIDRYKIPETLLQ